MWRLMQYCSIPFLCSTAFIQLQAHADENFQTRASDFLTENVCVDSRGYVQKNISPLSTSCIAQRQLRINENPAYYRNDWPNNTNAKKSTQGLQRSNSFPIIVAGQTMYASNFDFGHTTYQFGQFKKGDGGQLVAIHGDQASVVLTEDKKGLKFFFGANNCGKAVSVNALMNSWLLFDSSVFTTGSSSKISNLRQTLNTDSCPVQLDQSMTKWKLVPMRFRKDIDHHLTNPIPTIITDHFSQKNDQLAGAMERMYFTKELGWTRWEAWKNISAKGANSAQIMKRANALKESGRCDIRDGQPNNNKNWVMVDCREWTNIQPVDADVSKPSQFWIEKLLSHPQMQKISH